MACSLFQLLRTHRRHVQVWLACRWCCFSYLLHCSCGARSSPARPAHSESHDCFWLHALMCTYMHACTHAGTPARRHACTHACMHAGTLARTRTDAEVSSPATSTISLACSMGQLSSDLPNPPRAQRSHDAITACLICAVSNPPAGQVRPEPAGPPGVRLPAKPGPKQDPRHQRPAARGAGLLHKLLTHPGGSEAVPPAQADRIRPAPNVRGRRRNLRWTGRCLLRA